MPGRLWSSASPRTRRATRCWHACSAAAIAAALLPAPFAAAQAVTGTWNGSDGNWKDPLKWTGAVPGSGAGSLPGQDDVANLLKSTAFSTTVSLTDPRTIGTLHFDSANTYTISGTNALSFNASTGSAAILVTTANGAASTQKLSVPIRLNSPLSINAASASASLTLNSSITDGGGGFGVTFDGPGTVTMAGSGANSYLGPTVVNAGTLVLSRTDRSIPGTLIIGNGSAAATVRVSASQSIASNADVIVRAGPTSATDGGVFDGGAVIGSLSGGGMVTGTQLFVAGDKSTTFSGNFNSFGDFYKTGPSTLTLTGTNQFVAFNLSGGTVVLGSDGALGSRKLYLNDPLYLVGGTANRSVTLRATAARATGNPVVATGTVTFDGDAPMTLGAMTMTASTTLVVNADTTFAGVVSEDTSGVGLTKSGPGTLTIGVLGNSGATVINGGTLKLANGSLGATSGYTLNGGTLDVSAGGTNATLAVKLTGVSSTVLGSLIVKSNSSISGTNLTLGDLKISTSIDPALTGTLTAGTIAYGSSWQTIPAGTVIDGAGAVTLGASGILLVQGEVDKPFAVAGTLWGQGIIRGPVDVYKSGAGAAGGSVGAGDGKLRKGVLTTGDLTIESGGTLIAAMSGTNGSAINVNGNINLAGTLSVSPPGSPIDNTTYLVLNNDGFDPINGHFSNLPNDGDVLTIHSTGFDYLFAVNYHYDAAADGAANDVALTMSVVPTPEPAAPILLSLAATRLLMMRRRPRRP